MRKILNRISVVLFVALCAISCATKPMTPEEVATKYAKSIYTADLEEAKSYGNEETAEMLDFLELLLNDERIEIICKSKPTIEVISSDVDEESGVASVKLRVKNYINLSTGESEPEKIDVVDLVQEEDGRWLVDLPLRR